jgi:hypothetical protein
MVTVNLGRTEEQFWAMTPKRTAQLIREWSRMEELQSQSNATRIAYATVMMKQGKMPEWIQERKKKNGPINNDMGFANM